MWVKLLKNNNFVNKIINRRDDQGGLASYPIEFTKLRTELLNEILDHIDRIGTIDNDLLLHPNLSILDERVVEYSYVLKKIIEHSKKKEFRLLDAGCVLNNEVIKPFIKKYCNFIWFLNACPEKLLYENNVAYVLNDIRKPNLPENIKFDLITCLSTLEHIGMDNTRYGGTPKEFENENIHPENYAVDAIHSLKNKLSTGGHLLISVPYGPFEFLKSKGSIEPIYYTFDKKMIKKLTEELADFEVHISVYKTVQGVGWRKTDLDDLKILKHADQCAAAGAVCLIDAMKKYGSSTP